MTIHLTDATVKGLPLPTAGNVIHYDDTVPGFGLRVTAAGARSFVLNYRTKGGRERRITIGSAGSWQEEKGEKKWIAGPWRATAARDKAKELRRLIDSGGDPLAEIEEAREAPTVAELADRFEAEHLPRKRASTADAYERILALHVRPHFGEHTKVADVQFADVDRLHRHVTKHSGAYIANRTVAVLGKMFSLAIKWQWRTDNPCRGVERNVEAKRKRYLSGDELTRLTTALAAHPDKQTADIIRLLLLTGSRRGEVLGMRWADINDGVWTKPGSTTKQRTDHVVPLSSPAQELLSKIRSTGEYVFPSDGKTGHIVEIKKGWASICKSAGITGLRIHDLRHSFASQLASAGASLPLIGSLLGHSNPITTQRYSHLYADPQKAAVEKVAAIIEAASNGKPDNVKPFPKGRTRRK